VKSLDRTSRTLRDSNTGLPLVHEKAPALSQSKASASLTWRVLSTTLSLPSHITSVSASTTTKAGEQHLTMPHSQGHVHQADTLHIAPTDAFLRRSCPFGFWALLVRKNMLKVIKGVEITVLNAQIVSPVVLALGGPLAGVNVQIVLATLALGGFRGGGMVGYVRWMQRQWQRYRHR
jgi:hypothetical protein